VERFAIVIVGRQLQLRTVQTISENIPTPK